MQTGTETEMGCSISNVFQASRVSVFLQYIWVLPFLILFIFSLFVGNEVQYFIVNILVLS